MAIPVQESSGRLHVLGDLPPPGGAGLCQEKTGYPGAESEEKNGQKPVGSYGPALDGFSLFSLNSLPHPPET